VCLFPPSVTVCVVVCVRVMTSVSYAGLYSDDLWRFSTSTRDWERVNYPGPSGRERHVMTSVGLDLWVHGGSAGGETSEGESDKCGTHVSMLLFTCLGRECAALNLQ
jgi:hypothetical protein